MSFQGIKKNIIEANPVGRCFKPNEEVAEQINEGLVITSVLSSKRVSSVEIAALGCPLFHWITAGLLDKLANFYILNDLSRVLMPKLEDDIKGTWIRLCGVVISLN